MKRKILIILVALYTILLGFAINPLNSYGEDKDMIYTCLTKEEYEESLKVNTYDTVFIDENGKAYYWKGKGAPDIKNIETAKDESAESSFEQ